MVKEQSSSYFIKKEIKQTISVLLIVHILSIMQMKITNVFAI